MCNCNLVVSLALESLPLPLCGSSCGFIHSTSLNRWTAPWTMLIRKIPHPPPFNRDQASCWYCWCGFGYLKRPLHSLKSVLTWEEGGDLVVSFPAVPCLTGPLSIVPVEGPWMWPPHPPPEEHIGPNSSQTLCDGMFSHKSTLRVHEQHGTNVCVLNNTKRDLLQDSIEVYCDGFMWTEN